MFFAFLHCTSTAAPWALDKYDFQPLCVIHKYCRIDNEAGLAVTTLETLSLSRHFHFSAEFGLLKFTRSVQLLQAACKNIIRANELEKQSIHCER